MRKRVELGEGRGAEESCLSLRVEQLAAQPQPLEHVEAVPPKVGDEERLVRRQVGPQVTSLSQVRHPLLPAVQDHVWSALLD